MVLALRLSSGVVDAILLVVVGIAVLQSVSISASSPLQVTTTTETTTETSTLTSTQITIISFITTTIPTYQWTTSTLTSVTTSVSTTETTATSIVVSTQVQFRVSETTYTTSTTFVGVSYPTPGALSFGLLALFALGLALGLFSAAKAGTESEKIGGLLAALGFIFWGIIQVFSGFSTELSKLGLAGSANYVWWLIFMMLLGLSAGYYRAFRQGRRPITLVASSFLLSLFCFVPLLTALLEVLGVDPFNGSNFLGVVFVSLSFAAVIAVIEYSRSE